MSFKDLLVYVDNDKRCHARVRLAAEFAAHCNAHLTGVYAIRHLDIPNYASVRIPDKVLDAGEQSLRGLVADAEKTFLDAIEGITIESAFEALDAGFPQGLSARMRCADLAVLAQIDPDDMDLNVNYSPDEVVLQSGRPALIVPYAGNFVLPPRNVLLSWNAGREAARAVNDALPLLCGADKVCVVSIGESQHDLATLALHLARHDVEVETRHVPEPGIGADELLLSLSADLGSDLIVMGGYGRSRFRETVLGGMTRSLLAHMTAPVLMSH